jgi:hypothetical protein
MRTIPAKTGNGTPKAMFTLHSLHNLEIDQKAQVLYNISWKGLPGTNILAYLGSAKLELLCMKMI